MGWIAVAAILWCAGFGLGVKVDRAVTAEWDNLLDYPTVFLLWPAVLWCDYAVRRGTPCSVTNSKVTL